MTEEICIQRVSWKWIKWTIAPRPHRAGENASPHAHIFFRAPQPCLKNPLYPLLQQIPDNSGGKGWTSDREAEGGTSGKSGKIGPCSPPDERDAQVRIFFREPLPRMKNPLFSLER